MELNGKCKIDFEKWLHSKRELRSVFVTLEDENYYLKDIPLNMLYSVYVDFFDSAGIAIAGLPYQLIINEGSIQRVKINYGGFERREAREQAIIKANEIYNNSLLCNNK
jgi:hypothetical protein